MELVLVRGGRFTSISLVFFLTAILLLAAAAAVPRGQDVLWLNGLHAVFLDGFFFVITNAGDGVLFAPLLLIFLFIRFHLALVLAVAAALHGLLISVFKRWLLADATRPVLELDRHLLHFVPGVDVHAHHSFPSGHTASVFVIAFFLALVFNRKAFTAVALAVALAVAASRVYLLQHFLTDVAAGAWLGVVSVVGAVLLCGSLAHQPFFQRRISVRRPVSTPAGDRPLLD
jgi:membrane-associated phospholipid phosphatase